MRAVETVQAPKAVEKVTIDYAKLADLYNSTAIGGGVALPKVYNITVFSTRLEARGLKRDTDFSTFTQDGETVVKRLSQASMLRR